MKPEFFFNAWCETINNDKKEFKKKLLNWKEYWYNASAKTGLMESEIYHDLATELSLKCYVQYYYIDAVFYSPKEDLTPGIPPNTTALRKIRIALEHENNFNHNLYQELSHLLLINCDLRVIVSYPNNYDQTDVREHLLRIISTDPALKIENESVLLIFGVRGKASDIYWEGYKYKDRKWEIIKNRYPKNRYPIGNLVDSF